MPDLDPGFLRLPIAHRGLHDRARGVVENSRASVAAAIAGGYGIEIDIQRSADGEAMVFHDDDLPRLTGAAGPVSARSAADLATLPLTGAGETIPRLAEILDLVGGRAPLLIEIKDQTRSLGDAVGTLERRVAELLSGYGGPVAVMSFNPHSIAVMAEAAPGIPRGLTTCAFSAGEWRAPAGRRASLAAIEDFDRVRAAFVSHDRKDLASLALARLRARGVPAMAWTIRSPAQEAEARRVVDNVTFEGYPAPRGT